MNNTIIDTQLCNQHAWFLSHLGENLIYTLTPFLWLSVLISAIACTFELTEPAEPRTDANPELAFKRYSAVLGFCLVGVGLEFLTLQYERYCISMTNWSGFDATAVLMLAWAPSLIALSGGVTNWLNCLGDFWAGRTRDEEEYFEVRWVYVVFFRLVVLPFVGFGYGVVVVVEGLQKVWNRGGGREDYCELENMEATRSAQELLMGAGTE